MCAVLPQMHNSSNGKAADESQSLKMQRPVWPLQVAISADLLRSGMSQVTAKHHCSLLWQIRTSK